MFEIDISEADPSRPGGDTPKPGKAHLLITEPPTLNDARTQIIVPVLIAAHELQSEVGKTWRLWFPTSGKVVSKTMDLAVVTGLVTRDYLVRQREAGVKPQIPFHELQGRTFCTKLERTTTKDGREFLSSSFKLVDPASPEAEGWPVDRSYVAGAAAKTVSTTEPPSQEIPF